jgi:hypothetical protein
MRQATDEARARAKYCRDELDRFMAFKFDANDPRAEHNLAKLQAEQRLAEIDLGFAIHRFEMACLEVNGAIPARPVGCEPLEPRYEGAE